MNCNVCNTISEQFAEAKLLGSLPAKYYQCINCGFVQTEEPYWLGDAYSKPINNSDTGIMARNLSNSRKTSAILRLCFNSNAQYVDFGGGYGVFVRMMRDKGYDFYREDKYCTNLFANGFDASDCTLEKFELVTAFEVFEHFVSPLVEVKGLLRKSDSVLFSTEILPSHTPLPGEWWYYGLEHGQHISLYSRKSLQSIADTMNLNYYYCENLHLFTRVVKPFFNMRFNLAVRSKLSFFLDQVFSKKSLVWQDHEKFS